MTATPERVAELAALLRATGRYGDEAAATAAAVVYDVLSLRGVVHVLSLRGVVHPDDLVGVAELAREYGVGRSTINNWEARYDDFPTRVTTLACGPVFSRPQVRTWHDGRTWGTAPQPHRQPPATT